MHIKHTATLMITAKNQVERGLDMKFKRPNWFTMTPNSIRKAILNPIENNIFSIKSNSFKPNTLRRIKPGTNVRKRKPEHCLTKGISKISEITTTAWAIRT